MMNSQKPWVLSTMAQLAVKLITDKELVQRFWEESDYFKQFTDEIRMKPIDLDLVN